MVLDNEWGLCTFDILLMITPFILKLAFYRKKSTDSN